jgi:hypothetical protein
VYGGSKRLISGTRNQEGIPEHAPIRIQFINTEVADNGVTAKMKEWTQILLTELGFKKQPASRKLGLREEVWELRTLCSRFLRLPK